jgi:hypothetical protein
MKLGKDKLKGNAVFSLQIARKSALGLHVLFFKQLKKLQNFT